MEEELKSNYGEEAFNPDGIVPRAVKMVKDKFPDSIVCTVRRAPLPPPPPPPFP